MKGIYKSVVFSLVFILLPFCVFANDETSFTRENADLDDVDVVEMEGQDTVYASPTSDDWSLLKSFLSTMLNAECVVDNTFDKKFKLTEGEISSTKNGSTTYYYCKNVTLQSAFDSTELVRNLTGNFSFNPSFNTVKAKFVAVFPLLDSSAHTIKIHPVLKNDKLDYFIVNLDNKTFKVDQSSFYLMMLSGFEFALEYIFR